MRSTANALLERIRDSIAYETLDAADPIHEIGISSLSLLPSRPSAVRHLAYKKLHVYPFKDVPICWRRAYEDSCLWELLQGLKCAVGANASISEANCVPPNGTHGVNSSHNNDETLQEWIDDAVLLCDKAIIFTGAPRRRRLIDEILEWIDLEQIRDLVKSSTVRIEHDTDYAQQPGILRPNKRRRISDVDKMPPKNHSHGNDGLMTVPTPTLFPSSRLGAIPLVKPDCIIPRCKCPSLVQFEKHMHELTTPLIMTNTIDHWPAPERWKHPTYWDRRTIGGRRLVPVELGKSYTDEGWGQKIMSFKTFMLDYLLRTGTLDQSSSFTSTRDSNKALILGCGDRIGNQNGQSPEVLVGYLAQHDLLNQIPALRSDIAIPDYCYVDTPEALASAKGCEASSEHIKADPDDAQNHSPSFRDEDSVNPTEPMLNIWLGPANTISPAHTDPHHNILAQVFGRKYVRLFAPSQGDKMYPMSNGDAQGEEEIGNPNQGIDMGNTSRVDVGSFIAFNYEELDDGKAGKCPETSSIEEERQKFPDHESAPFSEAILEPSECLYIPRGWWHYVRSLEPSCNVSFWWD